MEFQSTTELESKRAEKRKAREEILREAKRKYDIEERKASAAKARGEDVWMLPELSQNIDKQTKKLKKKSKKLKKEKKSKHEKKAKKSKKKSNSSESEESEEDVWVEKTKKVEKSVAATATSTVVEEAVVKGPKLQRDDWMNLDSANIPTMSRLDLREKIKQDKLQYADVEKEQAEQVALDEPGAHHRELNPYWKSGSGTGLPEEQKTASSLPQHNLTFLKKAYARCQYLAEETGQSLESIAEERYGSLEKLETLIMEAERGDELVKAPSKGNINRPHRSRSRSATRGHSNKYAPRQRSRSGDRNRSYKRKSRSRSAERYRSNDRDRSSRRNRSRSNDRDKSSRNNRSRSNDRDKSSRRNRSRSNDRDKHRSRSVEIIKSNKYRSLEKTRHHRSRSRESHSGSRSPRRRPSPPAAKRRFLKPGESESSDTAKRSFMKPGDNSSSSSRPSWRKPDDKAAGKVESPKECDKKRGSSPKAENVTPQSNTSTVSSGSAESSSGSESEDEEPPAVMALTDDEMNALGAKILKAEIMGNEEMAAELKLKLEKARQVRATGVKPPTQEEKVVILSHTDKFGNVRPVQSHDPDLGKSGGKARRAKKVKTHDDGGQRQRYFADDDKFNIKDMVQAEKMTTAEDQHYMFSKMAAKVTEKIDDDNQIDDAMINRARMEHDPTKVAQQQQQRAQADSKKMLQTLDNCRYCLDNMTKHLIVAVSKNTYLCVQDYESLCEGHCKIIPIHHCIASTVCDEDVWNEVQEFRRNLVHMFADNGDQDCVFLECSKNLGKFPHMVVECIPVPRELGDMAPIYFKKAIDESETEWAQNKKLIDLSKKDIRHSVPKGFPYFAVDFGLQGGFAHVIEDERNFPSYFGKEVVGGMMDVDPRLCKKPRKESFEDQRKKVLNFSKMWKPYDFTITKDSDSESESD